MTSHRASVDTVPDVSKPPRPLEHLNGSIGRAEAFSVTVALVVVATSGLFVALGGDHGNLAGWIEALSTLGALFAAVIAAIYAARAFKLEGDREDARLDTQRREQASRVAAWAIGPEVWLMNGSDLPIYQVRVLAFADKRGIAMTRDVVPPTERQGIDITSRDFESLYSDTEESSDEFKYMRRVPVMAMVEFRDASGNMWLRDAKGNLSPITNSIDAPVRVPDLDDSH